MLRPLSLAVLVVVDTLPHKDALAKDMTLPMSSLVVAISMFAIGWLCGCNRLKFWTTTVYIYKKAGKVYHSKACKRKVNPEEIEEMTIAEAHERGFIQCKCVACGRVWDALALKGVLKFDAI